MNFYSVQFLPSLIGAALALFVAFIAERHRPGPAWRYMVALGIAVAWWCAVEILWLGSESIAQALRSNRIQYPAITMAPVLWLCVALAQTGHRQWLNPARSWILLVLPVITIALAIGWAYLFYVPHALVPAALALTATLLPLGGPGQHRRAIEQDRMVREARWSAASM